MHNCSAVPVRIHHRPGGVIRRRHDIPELDFNLAKVELVRAESRLLEVDRERIPLRIKIASLTGMDENDIKLYGDLSSPIPAPMAQDLVTKALSARPDLLAVVRERDSAETESRLATAEALPNLTAGIFVQWQRGSTEVGGMSSTNSDTQMGLRLSMLIPVFDRNRNGQAAARSRLEAAESRRLALERTITSEVDAAISRLSSSERIYVKTERNDHISFASDYCIRPVLISEIAD